MYVQILPLLLITFIFFRIGVRLGEHDIKTEEDCDPMRDYCAPPVQDFYIEEIITHPYYKSDNFANDVAILKLATPANFSYGE